MDSRGIKIWFPYVVGGSGTDIFTTQLAINLRILGYKVIVTPFDHKWQYFPWRLKTISPPKNTLITVTNTWNGFAFKRPGIKHITIAHLLVVDPANRPYRSFPQAIFHELAIRNFEKQSVHSADKVVAVSKYSARKLSEIYHFHGCKVIHNGIDTSYFVPVEKKGARKFRILFVGNLSRRKGADLLPKIMMELGDRYHLSYTSGLRPQDAFSNMPNMTALGALNQDQVLKAYQSSDILLFPTRLEGLPLVCAEAMACELPVVATDCSSLPEIVEHGVSGILCQIDSVNEFVEAIRKLSVNRNNVLLEMGKRARERISLHFNIKQMAMNYGNLISTLLGNYDR